MSPSFWPMPPGTGGRILLEAHFERTFGPQQGAPRLAALVRLLAQHKMAVSFEMVTGESQLGCRHQG